MSGSHRSPVRILHVDDDHDFAETTAAFLERENDRFAVDTATSAGIGLERIGEEKIDCVVSDYDMPDMDGIEFLETLRKEYPTLPFILFTGKGSEAVASEAISAGVTEYLRKRSGTEQYELLAARIASAVRQYRTERELERQNDLFAKAQDIADVGAWEYDVVAGTSYTTEECKRIHGLSPDDGLPPERSVEHYHPEDRPKIRTAFQRAIEEGDPYDLRLRLIDDDGRLRWVRTRGDPQFEDGDVVRVRGTVQDITDRMEREQELRRYEAMVEAIDDAVYAVDETGRIEYVNERYAEMKGTDREELLGTRMERWTDDAEMERIATQVAELERGDREVAKLEYEFLTTEGQRIPVEVRFTDLEFPDGERGRVGVIRDVSEHRDRERELEHKNEQLERFANVVSHDLRNPLQVAQGHLERAERTGDPEAFRKTREAHDRIETIIGGVFRLARAGETITGTVQTDIGAVAREAQKTVDTSGMRLVIDGNCQVECDPDRLRQLFENLFRNSIDHSDSDVTVTVGAIEVLPTMTRSTSDTIRGFYVADDGPGIDESDKSEILKWGYSTATDGTGFGLAIVTQIAEAHGWEITVGDSRAGGARLEFVGQGFRQMGNP